ncbi:unnamed protein product [Thelazia callipaeda]|uniref:5'-nucleotidase n=1 Tax=Thelazia callipaeda TaxID=103827 RepID=A0A0N5D882_THECL|nr:unnamed protein product [Thelazia callipaeda]
MVIDILLKNDKVRIRDVSTVEWKLNEMINAGKDKLLVISDFDYTLSRFHDAEGKSCCTTHGVFDVAAQTVSKELETVLKNLKSKYLPIEFDPHMTIAEKMPHMENWWRTSHQHIIKAGFTKQSIQNFVREAKLELKTLNIFGFQGAHTVVPKYLVFREGAQEYILALHDYNVPLIIFSAGVGNVIDFFMQEAFGQLPNNVHIVSNMMKYNENDVATAFSEPLIHTFSKNTAVISHYGSLLNEISSRTSVLLLGDTLGDSNMDSGLKCELVALKIGFLNYNDETLLNQYLHSYDIVLLDDQSLQVPSLILNSIFDGFSDEKNLSTCISCRFESEDNAAIKEGESVSVESNARA